MKGVLGVVQLGGWVYTFAKATGDKEGGDMAKALGNQTIIKRPKTLQADGNHERSRRRGGDEENEIVEGMEENGKWDFI